MGTKHFSFITAFLFLLLSVTVKAQDNGSYKMPPKDISEDVLEQIRAIASYNDETDAISPEFINDFFKSSLEFIQFMIDQGKSGND